MNLLPGVRCNNCLPNVISTDENFVEKNFSTKQWNYRATFVALQV